MMEFADVALDAPLRAGDRVFTFAIPQGLRADLQVGSVVRVPFGRRLVTGYVVNLSTTTSRRVKPIAAVEPRVPSLPPDLVSLAWWMAEYYVCSVGEAIQTMIPPLAGAVPARERVSHPEERPDNPPAARRADSGPSAILPHLTTGSPARVAVIGGDARFETYASALKWADRRQVGVIILTPEVSQADQLAGRVRQWTDRPVALVHGNAPIRERWQTWRHVHGGEVSIVVGTRVAVFAPLRELGLIIVDREEDSSYKEERAPRYHAPRVARERAQLVGATIVWGTVAPSMELVHAVDEAQAVRLTVGATPRPRVALVDVRGRDSSRTLLSPPLRQALARTLPRGRALVFVPRRGYADFLLCHECGTVPRCPRCDVAMTYHTRSATLRCHLCGRTEAAPGVCPVCGGTHLRPHGVGTERVEAAIRRLFRRTPVLRLDSDVAPDEDAQQRVWAEFAERGGLLVGTQLLVKGVGQIPVPVVGVIGVDAELHLPDYRASERAYQVLSQLAGLAQHEMIIQTFAPSHPALRAVARGESLAFYRAELAARRRTGYPPFRTLINLLVTGPHADAVSTAAQQIAAAVRDYGEVLGPSPAPRARIRGGVRWQVLVKEEAPAPLRQRLRELQTTPPFPRGVRLTVDVDPVDLL